MSSLGYSLVSVVLLLAANAFFVLGEQVPKTYAIRKPTPVSLALAYPLHWFYQLVFPLNWLLDKTNAGVTTLGGLVMQQLERLPEVGDVFVVSGLEFSVARMSGRQVQTVSIGPVGLTKPGSDKTVNEDE